MQTFEQYLRDIHMSENPELLDDDLPDDFDNWLGTLEQDIMIQYADDYAKEVHNNALKMVEECLPKKFDLNKFPAEMNMMQSGSYITANEANERIEQFIKTLKKLKI